MEYTEEEAKAIANQWIKEDMIKEGILKPISEIKYENLTDEGKDKLKQMLGDIYETIKEVIKNYSDLNEEYYDLISLWIIGTYLHEGFETYPYLFINAMRGSGKTRLLKLISSLSKNGELLTSLRESVLFRDSKGKTLCIDEFEGVINKENQALRELLNACYKKGMKVKRMKRKRTALGEEYVAEEFEPYTPICMANIWGMEEVLGDRCITLILEKSSNPRITRLMEDFSNSNLVTQIKKMLDTNLVSLCRFFGEFGYMAEWNLYINSRYQYTNTLTTLTTYTTETTLPKHLKSNTKKQLHFLEIFNKIHDTGINGRNLELMMPLFLIADFLSDSVFNKMLEIAEKMTKEKRSDEMLESRDVTFLDFISQLGLIHDFISIKKLTWQFRDFVGEDIEEEKWINTKWVGRALKRLSLIVDKRRMKEGREVIINIQKAIEKIKVFKNEKQE